MPNAAPERTRRQDRRQSPAGAASASNAGHAQEAHGTPLRVLHVDDEPDLREIVAVALGLDPDLTVESCASGADALMAASEAVPDLVLLDVMMPGMDGPTVLAHLRENPKTADVPAVFMTARAQKHEIEQFMALGAMGVIAKPFDPLSLAGQVRRYLQAARIAPLRAKFVQRACRDAAALVACRHPKAGGGDGREVLADIRTIAHGLAGAAGLYGFAAIGAAAAALEQDAIDMLAGSGSDAKVGQALETLLALLSPLADAELAHLKREAVSGSGRKKSGDGADRSDAPPPSVGGRH